MTEEADSLGLTFMIQPLYISRDLVRNVWGKKFLYS